MALGFLIVTVVVLLMSAYSALERALSARGLATLNCVKPTAGMNVLIGGEWYT